MTKSNKIFLFLLFFWTLWVVYWAWVLPYNMAPDECLHFKTIQYFQTHRSFPIADKEDITFINEPGCVGTTYISVPFINYIISALFIKPGNFIGIQRDYLAARLSSVFFGVIFLTFFYLFLKKLFKENHLIIFCTLISTLFIPQVTYIFAYLNQEAYSLASSSLLLFLSYHFYLLSDSDLRKLRHSLFLGLAVALQLFAKTNFYLLIIIPMLVLIIKIWQRQIRLKNLLTMMGVVFVISGWFFARNWILYKDLLGVRTYQFITTCNLRIRSYAQAGWNFYDVLFKSQWIEETASSFYGRFGYMTIKIDPVMQWIFRGFVFLGIVGLFKKVLSVKNLKNLIKKNIFFSLFILLIPINIALSLYNTLYFDFQNQGRYLFPVLIPIMVLVNSGVFGLTKDNGSKKTLTIGIIVGSVLLNFWSFLYLPKI